jgi:ubiquinone biosynthesis monooxygenase Coq7
MSLPEPSAPPPRHRDRLDTAISGLDRSLRALFAPARAARPLPRPRVSNPPAPQPKLDDPGRRRAASLMRVNHAGEVAAQALYHGQALLAREERTRDFLLQSALEEADHLAWCEQRLVALGARPSLLNPLWYAGSFALGALAASFGDRASLGFMAETERQVEGHISGHLERLPREDVESRAVLEAMRDDEVLHGSKARRSGAATLPAPVRELMRATSRVMTRAAAWI